MRTRHHIESRDFPSAIGPMAPELEEVLNTIGKRGLPDWWVDRTLDHAFPETIDRGRELPSNVIPIDRNLKRRLKKEDPEAAKSAAIASDYIERESRAAQKTLKELEGMSTGGPSIDIPEE